MKKILLVDNNAEMRNTLLKELNECDEFSVLSTGHAKTAAKLFEFHEIDLLITELDLPEIDGFKLLAYVRKKFPNTQTIAITANLSRPLIERLEARGFFYSFKKPVEIPLLFDAIFKQLGIQASDRISGISKISEATLEAERNEENYKKLEETLCNTLEILNYRIFNDRNTLLNESSSFTDFFDLPPSEYFTMANTISGSGSGNLKYLKIDTSNRSKIALIKSNQYFIAAEIKSGVNIDHIIRY